jgi:alkylhydroperoxidase family enzyme
MTHLQRPGSTPAGCRSIGHAPTADRELRARTRLGYHARMARLPYVDPASAPPEVRETLARLPVSLNVFRMMAHADTCFRPLLQLGTAILGRQALSPTLRELVILLVGRRSPAPYEWTQHVPIARATGATESQIASIEDGRLDADCFDEPTRAALAAAAELLERPRLSDGAFAGLERHFPAREIVELLVTVGYYMMVARLLESTAVDLDPPAGTGIVDSFR